MPPPRRIYLVACVARKAPHAAPAQELYTSDWFRKARAYVQKSGAPWFILSDLHGLVHPDQILEPYDVTLTKAPVAERRAWAQRVQTQMQQTLPNAAPDADEIVILAGKSYRQHLEPWLRQRYPSVQVPMDGLRIGQQQQWLAANEPD